MTQTIASTHKSTRELSVQAKCDRVEAANKFIEVIASNGRRYFEFNHDNGAEGPRRLVAKFRRDPDGKIWFFNEWRENWIYVSKYGAWRGFHHGGTLHAVVGRLVKFIQTGEQLWPGIFDEKHWGYADGMSVVVTEGVALGVIRPITNG